MLEASDTQYGPPEEWLVGFNKTLLDRAKTFSCPHHNQPAKAREAWHAMCTLEEQLFAPKSATLPPEISTVFTNEVLDLIQDVA